MDDWEILHNDNKTCLLEGCSSEADKERKQRQEIDGENKQSRCI